MTASCSRPARRRAPAAARSGIEACVTFRDLADVDRLLAAKGRAVVIGGGLLGLEAAYGLRRRGLEVTLVHLIPWLMERQLTALPATSCAIGSRRSGSRRSPGCSDRGGSWGRARCAACGSADGRELAGRPRRHGRRRRAPVARLARAPGGRLLRPRALQVDDALRRPPIPAPPPARRAPPSTAALGRRPAVARLRAGRGPGPPARARGAARATCGSVPCASTPRSAACRSGRAARSATMRRG